MTFKQVNNVSVISTLAPYVIWQTQSVNTGETEVKHAVNPITFTVQVILHLLYKNIVVHIPFLPFCNWTLLHVSQWVFISANGFRGAAEHGGNNGTEKIAHSFFKLYNFCMSSGLSCKSSVFLFCAYVGKRKKIKQSKLTSADSNDRWMRINSVLCVLTIFADLFF